ATHRGATAGAVSGGDAAAGVRDRAARRRRGGPRAGRGGGRRPAPLAAGRRRAGRPGDVGASAVDRADRGAPVGGLGCEPGGAELAAVVERLEAGGSTLEESLALWERGEELAAVCQRWLDGARARLEAARPNGEAN